MSEQGTWRLLVDGPRRGAWNMAVDETLLEGVSRGRVPPTVRFYQWSPPCLSLGYFQSYGAVDVEACRRAHVEIVRRPTGGRAILHHRELTYSIALPLRALEPESGVLQSYYRLSMGLTNGLRRLGVETSLAPTSPLREAVHGPACFDQPSDHEILLSGRKLVGSAQVRRNGCLLQHGSLLFRPQVNELLACLRLEPADREQQRAAMAAGVGGLDQAGKFTPREVAHALAAGLADVFGVDLKPGSLSRREKASAAELAKARYRTAAWTERSAALTANKGQMRRG